MARFKIQSKDGSAIRYEGKPRYIGTYLKPSYLEFSEIASPTPIAWEVGDYVDYPRTGMRYYLYSLPQASKNARKGSHGRAFTYSNVQLHAATKELEIAPFRDLVPNDNGIHFSTAPDVVTFEDVYGIARRIQACMDDLYPSRWEIRVAEFDPEADAEVVQNITTAKDFALSGGTCLDALSKIYELWQDIGWIHTHEDGVDVITIGYANKRIDKNTSEPYLYGKGLGLTAIKKNQTNKDEFATRLYVYGSERNLPSRYYNELDILNAESVDIRNLMLPLDKWGQTNGLPDARKAYLENAEAVAKFGVIPRTHYFDSEDAGADIYPSVTGMTIGHIRKTLADMGQSEYSPSLEVYPDENERVDVIKKATNPTDDGVINKTGEFYNEREYYAFGDIHTFTDIKKDETSKRLNSSIIALGQFETSGGEAVFKTDEDIHGYLVDYDKISRATLTFELTDSITKQKEFSKIVELELADAENYQRKFTLPSKVTLPFSTSEGISLYAVIYIDVEFKNPVDMDFSCEYVIESGNCQIEIKKILSKNFSLTLKQIGFDIEERATYGEGKVLSMKTGMCAGRNFDIKACIYNPQSDSWELGLSRQQDERLGVSFPNSEYPIKAGDQFVLLDIAMPELYIRVAMERLLVEGNNLLTKASQVMSHYEPSIDAKVMIESGRTLREGMFMEISDEDVVDNITDYILIDTLSIYEDESAIPTYKVTLRERRKVTYKGTPSATSTTSTRSATEGEAEDLPILQDTVTKLEKEVKDLKQTISILSSTVSQMEERLNAIEGSIQ